MNDLSGTTLGAYELKAVIGRGGMATVYRAYQPSMERDVALKILSPDLASEPEFVDRFEREARIVAQLQHPNILAVYDFGREGQLAYLVMKLLSGGNLSQALRGGPLPTDRIIRLTRQIGSALDYAHRRGIVHRDLKPSNVLLDDQGNASLTDFGIAKMIGGPAVTGLTAPNAVMGTPTYMAPEQWRSEPVDGRTDIYALGIIIYQMLLGQVPFASETPHGLMYQHLDRTPPSVHEQNPRLPQAVDRVLRRALAKLPDDRYPTAGELAKDLELALTSPARMPEQTSYDVRPPARPVRPGRTGDDEWVERDLLSRAGEDGGSPDLTIPARPQDEAPTLNQTMPSRVPQYAPPKRPVTPPPAPRTVTPPPRYAAPEPYQPPAQPHGDQPLVSTGYTPPYAPYVDDYEDEDTGGGIMRLLYIIGGVVLAILVLFGVVLVIALLSGSDNGQRALNPTAPPVATGVPTPTPAGNPPSVSQPGVVVIDPAAAVSVGLGEVVTIRYRANSPEGLTRVELQRFGRVLDQVSLGGVSEYEGTFSYQPDSTGVHVLQIVAWHNEMPSAPATVDVIVQ